MNAAVLLAEPEPSTREFLQRHLADDGFDVLGAEAEREALELLERLKPSLVLSSPELCRRCARVSRVARGIAKSP